jgi:acylglycerol lipase
LNNVSYKRKYLINITNPYVRLYFSNIKSDSKDTPINAKICIFHGLGHHSGEFYEYATFLAKNGINVFLIDLRGHGLSGGTRFEWKIEDFHTDIITLIKESEKDNIELPLFLMGHSLGGGLLSNLFINNPYLQVQGIIFTAPLLGPPLNLQPENPLKNFFVRNFGYHLKDFMIHAKINPSALTKNDQDLVHIINDKKMIPIVTPNSYRSMMKLIDRTLENCRLFSLNCIIFHGDKDKVTNLQHSKIFYENIRR